MYGRLWLATALAVTTGTLAVLEAGASASAAPIAHTQSAKPRTGFRIAGGGAPQLPRRLDHGTVVRTATGTEIVAGLAVSGHHYVLDLLTHRPGAAHWTESLSGPASVKLEPDTALDAQLSPNGRRVVVVVISCHSNVIYTSDMAVRSRRLPTPKAAVSGSAFACSGAESPVRYLGLVTSSHQRIAIAESAGNVDADRGAAFETGTAGHKLSAPVLLADPSSLNIGGVAMTRDPATGQVSVAGNDTDSNTSAYGAYVWTFTPSFTSSFTTKPPVQISSGAHVESITANKGRITVGVVRQSGAYGLLTRASSGRWSASVKPVSGTKTDLVDNYLIVEDNPKNGHLHAIWTRQTKSGQGDGVVHASRVAGKWSAPTYLVRHLGAGAVKGGTSYAKPLISFTPAGHPVVGYQQTPTS